MLSKILVPLDGSDLAEKALPIAAGLARRSQATICLVRISDRDESDAGDHSILEYLEAIAKSLNDLDCATCFHVGFDAGPEGIVHIASAEHAELIVMTTRGRTGIARGLLGSVTDEVISLSRIPVYVARSDNTDDVVDTTVTDGGVIVPLDGSELAETALEDVARYCRTSESPVCLLRVIDDSANQAEEDRAMEYLSRVADRLKARNVNFVPKVFRGAPSDSIIKVMSGHPGSVVVMTTRGAGGLTRWVRGSVADHLIRHAPGPVVVLSNHSLIGSVIH